MIKAIALAFLSYVTSTFLFPLEICKKNDKRRNSNPPNYVVQKMKKLSVFRLSHEFNGGTIGKITVEINPISVFYPCESFVRNVLSPKLVFPTGSYKFSILCLDKFDGS